MERRLSLSLRLLSLFFAWYVVAFALSIASQNGIGVLAPEFRGEVYVWDFELFFAAIYAVWALYLWKASARPREHALFIGFTLWATAAHIAAMLVAGFIRSEDLMHLLIDAVALGTPTALATYFWLRV